MAFSPNYPYAQQAPSMTQGAAVGSDRQSVVNTTKAINKIQGTKELVITLTNTTNAAKRNILIFPGVQTDGDEVELPEGVQFEASGFETRAAFLSYWAHVSAAAAGLRLETDNTLNIEGNSFFFAEKEPDGEDNKKKFPIGKYKHDIGGGMYSREIEIPASDLTMIIWAPFSMALDKLAPNSSVTLFFPMGSWNKSQDLVLISESRL